MTPHTSTPDCPTSPAADQNLTPKQLAHRWQVQPSTITAWARRGEIEGAELMGRRRWRFAPDARRVAVSPRPPAPEVAPAARPSPRPSLTPPAAPPRRRNTRDSRTGSTPAKAAASGTVFTNEYLSWVMPD